MAERLPFGQITPVARPLSTYLSAREQSNTPQAAKPYDINTRASLNTVQPGNGGNISSQADPGKRLAQTMEALQPFNRALTSAVVTGAQVYATNQIDAGYADARNEFARAQLVMQQQQEAAATNAGSQITQLEKVDPVAAILLQDANPGSRSAGGAPLRRSQAVKWMTASRVHWAHASANWPACRLAVAS